MISPYGAFDYEVKLERLPSGVLGGTAAVPAGGYGGLVGPRPAVRIEAGGIVLAACPEDRPRWWMWDKRRPGLATRRQARIRVGPTFERFVLEGDLLTVSLTMPGARYLTLWRAGVLILAMKHVSGTTVGGMPAPGSSGEIHKPVVTIAGEERVLHLGERVVDGAHEYRVVGDVLSTSRAAPGGAVEVVSGHLVICKVLVGLQSDGLVDECAQEFARAIESAGWR